MSAGSFLCHRRARLLFGLLVVLVTGALRLPWLDADPGNRGLWGSFFLTDEGEYTAGGRIAYMRGTFIDPELSTPNTLPTSPAMHLLSYGSYRVFGLKYGTIRVPSVLAAVAAWFCAYWLASRYTAAGVACAVTLLVSCNPLSVSYERVVSTDGMAGVLTIVSVVCALRKTSLSKAAAGLFLGIAFLFKPTAVLFAPMVGSLCIFRSHKWRQDVILFLLPWLAVVGIGKWWVHSLLQGTSFLSTDSVWKATQLDPWTVLRIFSNFPKYPFSVHMGLMLPVLIAVPAWCWLVSIARSTRRWTVPNILCAGVLFFAFVLSTQTWNSARYFLPAIYWLPVLLVFARRAVWKFDSSWTGILKRIVGCFAVLVVLYWIPMNMSVGDLRDFASGEAFTSARFSWILFWPKLLMAMVTLAIFAKTFSWRRWTWREYFLAVGVGAVVMVLMFSNYVHSYEDVYGTVPQQSYLRSRFFSQNQIVLQLGVCGLALLFSAHRTEATWRRWYGGWLLLLIGFCVFNTHWRGACAEMFSRHDLFRTTSREIEQRIPPGSIVAGQRASSLLRATSFRTGFGNANRHETFIPGLLHLLDKPGSEIYWLVESDWDPFWMDYEQNVKDRLHVQVVETYSLPSMLSPNFVPVYLVRVTSKNWQ